MIRGLGIDLSNIDRFSRLADKEGFMRNVFTEAERAQGRHVTDRGAARTFALKEAVLKAVGCGLSSGSFWRNIEIDRDASVRTSGPVEKMAAAKAVTRIHNSAACTREQALCVVLLESDN